MKKIYLSIIIGIVVLLSGCQSQQLEYNDVYVYNKNESGEPVYGSSHFKARSRLIEEEVDGASFVLEAVYGDSSINPQLDQSLITYIFELQGGSDLFANFSCNNQNIGSYYVSADEKTIYYGSLRDINIFDKCFNGDIVSVSVGTEQNDERITKEFVYYKYAQDDTTHQYSSISIKGDTYTDEFIIVVVIISLLVVLNISYRIIYTTILNKNIGADKKIRLPGIGIIAYLSVPFGLVFIVGSLMIYNVVMEPHVINNVEVVDYTNSVSSHNIVPFDYDMSDFSIDTIYYIENGVAVEVDSSLIDVNVIAGSFDRIFKKLEGENVSTVEPNVINNNTGYLFKLSGDEVNVTIFVTGNFKYFMFNTYSLNGDSTIEYYNAWDIPVGEINYNTSVHPNFYTRGINVNELMDIVMYLVINTQ